MLIIDFAATRARIDERCINLNKVARKFGINPRSLHLFVKERFMGQSGKGVYGNMERALLTMNLLVLKDPGQVAA